MNPDKMRWNVTEKTDRNETSGSGSRKVGEDVSKF